MATYPTKPDGTFQSRWRQHARNVILDTLDQCGPAHDERVKAVRAAYPFGERAGHPYKIWLSEVKRLVGTAKRRPSEPVTIRPDGSIQCGWCSDKACIACAGPRAEIATLADSSAYPEFQRLASAAADQAPWMLGDWLEERGFAALAELCRRQAKGGTR